MEQVAEVVNPQPGGESPAPAAPAAPSVDTSAQPEIKQPEGEGTGKEQEQVETPQKRESRRQRQLSRERERRITAETELRLLREQQGRSQPVKQTPSDDPEAPRRDQFDSYEDYIRADARHEARKEAREAARKEHEALKKSSDDERVNGEREKVLKAWNSQIEKARDDVEDFDEVTSESEAPITQAMSEAILESDSGALIAYHLAKNPAEAERISKLPRSRQAVEIVKLEEKLAQPARRTTKAPDPITPVGGKVEVSKDPAKMSQAEYNAWRNKGGK